MRQDPGRALTCGQCGQKLRCRGNLAKEARQAQKAWYFHSPILDFHRLNAGKNLQDWNTEVFATEDVVRGVGRSMEPLEPKWYAGMQYCPEAVYCMDIVLPFADCQARNVYLDSETGLRKLRRSDRLEKELHKAHEGCSYSWHRHFLRSVALRADGWP